MPKQQNNPNVIPAPQPMKTELKAQFRQEIIRKMQRQQEWAVYWTCRRIPPDELHGIYYLLVRNLEVEMNKSIDHYLTLGAHVDVREEDLLNICRPMLRAFCLQFYTPLPVGVNCLKQNGSYATT
jgi:hypothetical protein